MHPAEFRTLREQLFLNEKDVSMLTLVKEAQLKAWELGEEDIPAGTAGLLRDVQAELDKRIKRAIAAAEDKETVTLIRFKNPVIFKREGPNMAPIPPFLAFKCHCSLIAQLRVAFLAQRQTVRIRYFASNGC